MIDSRRQEDRDDAATAVEEEDEDAAAGAGDDDGDDARDDAIGTWVEMSFLYEKLLLIELSNRRRSSI